ncbi:integral membrane protein [Murmansk poxvirus]|uniref:Protein OPG166 n=1 Tax=Murmansk poxvirus TaxID=2025359 RepID=A0A223FMZ6_9POXV|nr:integral membrane protein [Murmansk poxvirus]AST09350.1 integral membrane protein [Murmansk poxvirus]
MLSQLFYLYIIIDMTQSKIIEYTACNNTIIIPCHINNPTSYVRWKLDNHVIMMYNKSTSATILSKWHTSARLHSLSENDVSLIIEYKDILPGNYTCEDNTGIKSNIQLVLKDTNWFNDYDTMLMFICSGITLFLLLLQVIYTSISARFTNNLGILQFFSIVIIMIELCGSLLFYPSKFTIRHIVGLLMMTLPSLFLIITKIFSFWILNKLSCGVHIIIYYQLAGYLLTILGLGLSLKECVNGSLLLSGLGIITISEHFSLLLLVCFPSTQRDYY